MSKKIPILSSSEEIIKSLSKISTPAKSTLLCFYSNHLNAIITDKNFISIPFEDKIIHRAYSVFDTTKIYGNSNSVYNLKTHLERLFFSIERISLKPYLSQHEAENIVIETGNAARYLYKEGDIDIRMYYSAGLGSFFLKEYQDLHSFYVIAYKANNSIRPVNGTKDYTIKKFEILENIKKAKKTDYLANCIVSKIIQEKGGYLGLFIDEDGNFTETPISCLGFVKNGVFYVPSFDKTLRGTTAVKCIEFAEEMVKRGELKGVSRKDINIKDVIDGSISEAMYLGGDFAIPLLEIDDIFICKEKGLVTSYFQMRLEGEKRSLL